jgi:hypothetical protein
MMLNGLTLESPELQEFVTLAIADQTKSLQSQVSKLNNQLNAKNQPKGANSKASPQPQKQKGRKDPSAHQPKPKDTAAGQKAANVAKGSTNANNNRGKPKRKSRPKKKKQVQVSLTTDRAVRSMYGFVADPEKTNSHNLAIQLISQSTYLLSSGPSNLACHNLCTHRQPPKYFQSLLGLGLGLGLNFCPTPSHTTGLKDFEQVATASGATSTPK